ncbi:MAG: hypothetical protein RIB63_17295, partial [Fulvivirga sp.]
MKIFSVGCGIIIYLSTTLLNAQHINTTDATNAPSGDIYHLSGRIGIGTTTPLSLLEVKGTNGEQEQGQI